MGEPQMLLSLTVPPNLEEAIIDWLLDFESHHGFSSFPVNGHSSRPEGLTLAEQVSGRKRNVRFEICLPAPDIDRLIEALGRDYPNASITFWVTRVEKFGRLAPAEHSIPENGT
jgi:hypothetical protein